MYSLSFFGSTISFCFSSSFSSLSNDGKLCIWVSFSLFSILGRGSVLRFSWGFHTTGGDRQVESTQKKDAWRKSKPITIHVCFVFDIEGGEGLWGEGRKRIHPLDIISFCLLVFFVDHRFLQLSVIPWLPKHTSGLFSFSLKFFERILGFRLFPYLPPSYPQTASFSIYSLNTFLSRKIGSGMNVWLWRGGILFVFVSHFFFLKPLGKAAILVPCPFFRILLVAYLAGFGSWGPICILYLCGCRNFRWELLLLRLIIRTANLLRRNGFW